MKWAFTLTIYFLLSLDCFSLGEENFEDYHREFLSHNPNEERKTLVYLIAGQEFLFHKDYKNAKKFYQLAINTKGQEDKTQAYIDLILIAQLQDNEAEARTILQELKTYVKAHEKYQSDALTEYLAELENYLSEEPHHRAQVAGYLRQAAREKNFAQAMKDHDYLLALSYINLERVPESGIIMQTKVDLLRSLTGGPSGRELFCAPTFKKHPNAFSYSMMICSLLHDYHARRPLDQQKLSQLEDYFKTNHQHEVYLLDLVKKLRGPRP